MNKEKLIRDLTHRIDVLCREQTQASTRELYNAVEGELYQLYTILNDVREGKYDELDEYVMCGTDLYYQNLQNLYIEKMNLYRYNLLYKVIIYTLLVILFISHAMR